MKKCSKCHIKKPFNEFHNQKDKKDGKMSHCKDCRKIIRREYYLKNKDKARERSRISYLKNKDKVNERNSYENKKEYLKEYREKNREKIKEYAKDFYHKNKGKYLKKIKNRRKNDSLYRLKLVCRSRTIAAFKAKKWNKRNTSRELLGADYNVVKKHIEDSFSEGMSWDNHGEWHIDHIIPLDSAENEDELIQLCNYKNLQALWAHENISKSNKLNY